MNLLRYQLYSEAGKQICLSLTLEPYFTARQNVQQSLTRKIWFTKVFLVFWVQLQYRNPVVVPLRFVPHTEVKNTVFIIVIKHCIQKKNDNKKQQSMKIFMKQNTHKQKNKIIWKPSNWIRFSCLYHWKYWKVDYICTWPTKISVIFLMWISKAFILITPSYIWQSNSNNTQLLLLYVIHFLSFCSNNFLWSYVLFRNFNNVSIIALIQRSN